MVIYGIAFACMAVLFFKNEHIRKRDTPDAKNIFMVLVLIVAGIVSDKCYMLYNPSFDDVNNETIFALKITLMYTLKFLRELIILFIIICWNRFVDFVVYKSLDHVKKKYKRAIIPAALFACIPIIIKYVRSPVFRELADLKRILAEWLGNWCYILQFYYVANAIWIAWKSNKERKAPTCLRLDVFVIPLVAGYAFNYIYAILPVDIWINYPFLIDWLTTFDARFPFLVLAAVLTWGTVKKRYRYMDQINGFYNKEFLADMNDYMEKSGYPNGIGVYFKVPRSEGRLIPVLNSIKPEDSEIFSLGEDEYLLMAGPQKESVIRLLIKSVKLGLAGVDDSLAVTSDYLIREKEESPEAFTKRLLDKAAAMS